MHSTNFEITVEYTMLNQQLRYMPSSIAHSKTAQ